jgi:hypothetical protein
MRQVREGVVCGSVNAHIASVVHILRVPPGCHSRVGCNAAIDRVDTPEGVHIYFEIGQSDIGARLEGCSVASSGRVKKVDGRENGVGIDSGATAASICGKVASSDVFVGLNYRLGRRSAGYGENVHLLEAQEVVCLLIVPWNDAGLAKLLS